MKEASNSVLWCEWSKKRSRSHCIRRIYL